jgi:hypothetical protein
MTRSLAAVGLTEKHACKAGYRAKIVSDPVAEITAMPRAYVVEKPAGR